jgi:Transmembrane secretion effector
MVRLAMQTAAGVRASRTWQPLRRPVFRALWIAVLFSNIENWMETVGAQWLLVSQPGNSITAGSPQPLDQSC